MSSPECLDINMKVENTIDDIRSTVREKIKGFYVSIFVIFKNYFFFDLGPAQASCLSFYRAFHTAGTPEIRID